MIKKHLLFLLIGILLLSSSLVIADQYSDYFTKPGLNIVQLKALETQCANELCIANYPPGSEFYFREGRDCENACNAARLAYDGESISVSEEIVLGDEDATRLQLINERLNNPDSANPLTDEERAILEELKKNPGNDAKYLELGALYRKLGYGDLTLEKGDIKGDVAEKPKDDVKDIVAEKPKLDLIKERDGIFNGLLDLSEEKIDEIERQITEANRADLANLGLLKIPTAETSRFMQALGQEVSSISFPPCPGKTGGYCAEKAPKASLSLSIAPPISFDFGQLFV